MYIKKRRPFKISTRTERLTFLNTFIKGRDLRGITKWTPNFTTKIEMRENESITEQANSMRINMFGCIADKKKSGVNFFTLMSN